LTRSQVLSGCLGRALAVGLCGLGDPICQRPGKPRHSRIWRCRSTHRASPCGALWGRGVGRRHIGDVGWHVGNIPLPEIGQKGAPTESKRRRRTRPAKLPHVTDRKTQSWIARQDFKFLSKKTATYIRAKDCRFLLEDLAFSIWV